VTVAVRAYGDDDLAWAEPVVERDLGGRWQVRRGELVDALVPPGWVAERDGRPVGLLTAAERNDGWELVLLLALERRSGIGSLLVPHLLQRARDSDRPVVWVVTTNDNTGALAFYQRLGFRLSALRVGAVDAARATVKPQIPAIGDGGIRRSDELELTFRW